MVMALLALACALVVPAAWGWFVHWLFYKYRLLLANSLAKLPREPIAAADSDDWYYQI